jgi:hypothetical protein
LVTKSLFQKKKSLKGHNGDQDPDTLKETSQVLESSTTGDPKTSPMAIEDAAIREETVSKTPILQ